MEDPGLVLAEEDKEGTLPCTPSSPASPAPVAMKPSLSGESMVENQAVAMANNDNSPTLSSPTEASPAKPAVTFPSITNGTIHTSPTTSDITSASDSLTSAETNLVKAPMPSAPLLTLACPSETSSDPVPDMQVAKCPPPVLTFKGISVTLENNSVWKQFHGFGTEMILTKQGRRMFPYCRYRLSGLEPARRYSLVLSIAPADQHKYRWSMDKWEVSGPAEHQCQGLIRAFSHHHSPCLGAAWMDSLVSFYKLKLTNNPQDQDGHMILHSMHRYIPRLHVIPVPDGDGPTPEHPVVKGPESLTFTFPQTEFFAVTSYQNLRITRLKIDHNPFARGFRDDAHMARLPKPRTEAERAASRFPTTPNSSDGFARPNSSDGVIRKDVVGVWTKRPGSASPSDETRARQWKLAADEDRVGTDASARGEAVQNGDRLHLHRQHLRAQLALPPRQLSQDTPFTKRPDTSFPVVPVKHPSPSTVPFLSPKAEEAKDKRQAVRVKVHKPFSMAPKPSPVTPTSLQSSPALSPGCVAVRSKKKRINRHWGNSRGKAGSLASTPTGSPPATVTTQPELDDVEGLLFVSFTSKEALGVHVEDMPARSSPPVFRAPPPPGKTVEEFPEADEEKIARLQAILLRDLPLLKHRQVIHPVLQEVGLKLSSLDPTQAIDLQYLGVSLPLPPLVNSGQANAASGKSMAFVSRTGKTSDLTKIKGWRDKLIKNKESSAAQRAATPKNLSAFCSNMLDEYLESEADKITERAAAFSTNHDSSVAYQLPATSSSYVKTLDSALKRRNLPAWSNRPCPLSFKPQQYLMNMSPRPVTGPPQKAARPKGQSVSPPTIAGPRHIAPKPWQFVPPVKKPTPKARAKCGTKGSHVPSPEPQGPTPADPGPSHKCGRGVLYSRPSGLSKHQVRLIEMEEGAINQGLDRTRLTPQRLKVALSVILTAKTLNRDRLGVPVFRRGRGPECGQEFCRLGCVCSSLYRAIRGPLHCRRPACMLGCTCFKRKITKQAAAIQHQSETVYAVCNVEHEIQPSPGFHSRVLWDKTLPDPEPIFSPKPSQEVHGKLDHKRYVPRLNQPVREEDKDPIYKYFESMMTCARVREFTRSKGEPQSNVLPHPCPSTKELLQKFRTAPQKKTPNTIPTANKKAGKAPPQEQPGEPAPSKQVEIQSECKWAIDRKMILEGLCRRMHQNRLSPPFHIGPYLIRLVSKVYTRKQKGSTITYKVRLSKPSEPSVSKEGKSEDGDDEVTDCSSVEEEEEAVEEEAVAEEKPAEEPETPVVGVTPFLGGVLPAGRLRAKTKPSGRPATGLIQVNGKSYTQARLLLGSMGSLHPANRLAAYITGRLRTAGRTPQKGLQKADSTPHIQDTVRSPGKAGHMTTVRMGPKELPASPTPEDLPSSHTLLITPPTASDSFAGSPPPALSPGGKTLLLQPIATAQGARLYRHPNGQLVKLVPKKQMTEIKARVVSVGKSLGQSFRPNIQGKGQSSTTPPHSITPSQNKPLITFITGSHGSITTAQNSSSTSPSSASLSSASLSSASLSSTSLSLSLSPTLKTPSFLGQRGTYSFRICPPAADQASRGLDQSPPGRTLPGGFTLIQLPKPWLAGARAAVQPPRPVNCTSSNVTAVPARQNQTSTPNHSETNRTHAGTKDRSNGRCSGPGSFPDLMCDEKIPSDESDNTEKRKPTERVESDPDMASEDDLSDSSDSDEQDDVNEDAVDIETVEETGQMNTIDKMRAAARRLVLEARDSSEDSESAKEHRVKGLSDEGDDESEGGGRRRNHKVTERLRRTEQRHLFNRLQTVLHIHDDPRAPKLRLLSLALAEIQNLVWTSRCLEENKRKLKEMQSVYVKEISRLSGRPEELVKNKLREICERRKAMTTERSVHLPPTLKPRPQTPKPHVPAEHVKPQPPTLLPPRPRPQPTAPAQVTEPQSQLVDRPQAPPPTVPGQPPSPLQPQVPKSDSVPPVAVVSPPAMALPLIRSKTGRIILPSSLRPAGSGYYTLTVMKADKERKEREREEEEDEEEEEEDEEEEEEESSGPQTQPSDLDPSKDGERTPSECEPLTEEGENRADGHGITEEENASSALNTTAHVSKKSPAFQMTHVNRATWRPPPAALQTACLSFNPGTRPTPIKPNPGTRPTPIKPKPQEAQGMGSEPVVHPGTPGDGSTPVQIRRGRGRPRKHPRKLESKSVETASEDGERTRENPDSRGTTKEEETSSALNHTGHVSKKSPHVEIARIDGALWTPQAALRTVGKSLSGGKVSVLGGTKPRVNHGTSTPAPLRPKLQEDEEEEVDVVPRSRGRPRKHPLPQSGDSESADKAKRTKTKQAPAPESPEPVKRGPGRPPKKLQRGRGRPPKKPQDSASPGAKSAGSTRAGGSPVTRAGGSPARATRAQRSPATAASPAPSPGTKTKDSPGTGAPLRDVSGMRPVTRGALGKDFPSAKKRSWRDIENEIDSESEDMDSD